MGYVSFTVRTSIYHSIIDLCRQGSCGENLVGTNCNIHLCQQLYYVPKLIPGLFI